MKTDININEQTCIKCSKCVKICVSSIFKASESSIEIENQDSCILCGHCMGVCPTGAITHSEFPESKVHAIDQEAALPTPEQVMMLCKSRRSNRAFSKQPVSQEMLDQILEAAHRAPTASNMQQVEFTLVTDPEKLKEISNITISIFGSIVRKLNNPLLSLVLKPIMPSLYKYIPHFNHMLEEHKQGNDMILRQARALIFIHTPEESRFGTQDANLAYQNGSLMAQSLGVSQFYTGFVCSAIKQAGGDKIAQLLGIKGAIQAGMALGMPSVKFVNYIDKKDIVVNKI